MSEFANDVLSSPLPWIVALVGVGIWVGKVNERTSAVSNVMIEIRNELRTIVQKVEQVLLRVDCGVARGSPLQLTEVGKSMSETLGSTAWAEAKALDLFEQARGMGPYDVQEFSKKFVTDEFKPDAEMESAIDAEMESAIKACAYEHGLQRNDVLQVLAVELRDQLLALLPATGRIDAEDRNDGGT